MTSWTKRTPRTSAPVPRTGPSARRRAPRARTKRVMTIAITAIRTAKAIRLTTLRTSGVRGVAAGDGDRARAGGAARVRLLVDQQLRERADDDEDVGADHQPEVASALETPRRIRQQQVDERAQHEAADQHAEGEDPVVVRLGERAEEPEVRDEDEQEAGAVVRATPERDHARDEEREPDREGEREKRGEVLDVVAREDERRPECGQCQAAERDQGECAGPHPSKSASAVPPNSALGMKPRAPLCSISSP